MINSSPVSQVSTKGAWQGEVIWGTSAQQDCVNKSENAELPLPGGLQSSYRRQPMSFVDSLRQVRSPEDAAKVMNDIARELGGGDSLLIAKVLNKALQDGELDREFRFSASCDGMLTLHILLHGKKETTISEVSCYGPEVMSESINQANTERLANIARRFAEALSNLHSYDSARQALAMTIERMKLAGGDSVEIVGPMNKTLKEHNLPFRITPISLGGVKLIHVQETVNLIPIASARVSIPVGHKRAHRVLEDSQ